jgi:N-acetylglucosaminyldiphosphoundecaprenol N-acetyl-beta-D-mannosaminyltransferase
METDDESRSRFRTVEVLGVHAHVVTTAELTTLVADAVRARRRMVVGNHNLHSVYLVNERPELGRFYDLADVVFIDGMSLVAAAKLARQDVGREHRSTPLDWFHPLLDALPEGDRVFLLGSEPGAVDESAQVFRRRHPHLTFATHHGYFDASPDSDESLEVCRAIDAAAPNLLLVGMGMPRQEEWVADHLARLEVPVILTVGGLFDYYNGRAGYPPRWMGQVGLEWLYRLVDDPRRLARRYLLEPLLLARLAMRRRR